MGGMRSVIIYTQVQAQDNKRRRPIVGATPLPRSPMIDEKLIWAISTCGESVANSI